MQPPSPYTQTRPHVSVAPSLDPVPEDIVATASTLTAADMDKNRSHKPITPVPASGKSTFTVHTTPIQRSGDSGEHNADGTISKTAVEKYLQTLLGDKVKRDFPVVEFIEAVWGLPWDQVPLPKSGRYTLKEDAVVKYISNEYHRTKDIKTEQNAYGPLQEIIEDIVEQVVSSDRVPGTKTFFVNMRDHTVEGFLTRFKPDFVWSWLKGYRDQTWMFAALCGELKKSAMQRFKFSVRVDMEKLKTYTRVIRVPENVPQSPVECTHDSPALAPHPEPLPATTPQPRLSSTEPLAKRKRTPDGDSEAAESNEPRVKRTKSGEGPTLPLPTDSSPDGRGSETAPEEAGKLSPNELQIARYINENGSHGIRSYATGVLIEDCDVILWYIDRMGVIKSSSFNFITESHIFVYFIASITLASFRQLGICPLLKFPASKRTALDFASITAYEDVYLHLRKATDIKERPLTHLLFSLKVSLDRPIIPSYGSVGRASVIVPIEANNATHKKITRTDKVASTELPTSTGPAASQMRPRAKLNEPTRLVAKISWQSKWRKGEDVFVRKIRKGISKAETMKRFLDNIVDMKCSADFNIGSEDIDLPRAKMFGMTDSVYERVCRVLVLQEYLPLQKVRSPTEFKTIFIDVVQAHHAVYQTSKILHRDISPSNIMFYYRNVDTKDPKAVGVLCDWDLAKLQPQPPIEVIITDLTNSDKPVPEVVEVTFEHLESEQPAMQPSAHQPHGIVVVADSKTETKEPRYRTGTGPFIALDILLYNHIPYHLYRHDLESFFWVLVWFVTCFDPVEGKIKHIDSWLQSSLFSIGDAKVAFLDNTTYPIIVKGTHESYMPICDTWVKKLKSDVISKVYKQYDKYTTELFKKESLARLKKNFDAAVFAKQMQRDVAKMVEKRETILTFESFMKCLT